MLFSSLTVQRVLGGVPLTRLGICKQMRILPFLRNGALPFRRNGALHTFLSFVSWD